VVSQKLHVPQKLLAVNFVSVSQVLPRREIEKEAEAVVVRSQRLLALALLVFALKKLKFGEPLIDSVNDFRPSPRLILVVNDRDICVESLEVCLLALSGGDCLVEVVAHMYPGTVTVPRIMIVYLS